MCLASPPSPDLLNISCDRISWSSIRIRIGLICERWRKEWMALCRSGPRSAVRTFPCPWPALRWQCDCVVDCVWNVMAHAQKPDFVFRRNWRVNLNRRGRQFSRLLAGVRISGSNAGYTMFRGSVKSTGYPLHSPVSPSLPFLCVTVCHYISTGLYLQDYRERSVIARVISLAVPARAATGYAGSATF